MDLDELLGIDRFDPQQALAGRLVAEDRRLLDDLIESRKRAGMNQAAVGEAMGGISQSAVARIESGERDPHLSTLRRYALAVGVEVVHRVRKFEFADHRARIDDILAEFDVQDEDLPDGPYEIRASKRAVSYG
ncbi:helix-turn-helix transcriptional regulator [Isoptericola haloaureus]|uniref:Helix-turn-helix transcriptional regulator n=1 Tax=Isoptericola haloaureus TaxID=1542902 RepID=A0ABU7Z806_9MICO